MRRGTHYSLRKKPCPACKVVDPYRAADEICKACAGLIEEAKAAREAAATMKGTELVRLPWAAHGMGYILHGHEYGENVRKALFDIMYRIGVPSPGEVGYGAPVVIGGGSLSRSEGLVRFPVGLRPLFDALYENIVATAEKAYEEGYQDGHQMLVRLAKGELSTAEFNEIGAGGGLPVHIQKRRKRARD